ncbi:ABC transporter ATP-binding protein [Chloroflexales bacterium ZM16-3]|nr:ABC transporter ATP-binding protein [Chloroflexales bacterium ZM16-3]
MLRIEQITKRFGGLTALDRVDLAVDQGQLVGLIGPNGSGKSTLFGVISGFHRPEHGRIVFAGQDIVGRPPHAIARLGVGRTFQIVRPFTRMSAIENVEVGLLYGQGIAYGTAAQQAREILEFVGLGQRIQADVANFTLADKKRLEIARALSTGPRLLLLDEVFAGLNPVEVRGAISLIRRMRDELKLTIIMVEHVLSAVMETCERVMVLSYGQKIAEGTPEEITRDPDVIRVYLGTRYAHH